MTTEGAQQVRREKLCELVERYGLTIGADNYSGNEDITEYFPWDYGEGLVDPKPIARFAAVTRGLGSDGGTLYYVIPDYDTAEQAQERAAEYVSDGIFEEMPVAVIDLDTGAKSVPAISWSWPEPVPTTTELES